MVLAATKIIWNSDVPTTNEVGIPKRYIIAGTIINPPPMPIIAARTPTIIPIRIGSKIDMYNFSVNQIKEFEKIINKKNKLKKNWKL